MMNQNPRPVPQEPKKRPHFWGHNSRGNEVVGNVRKGDATCRPASRNGNSGNVVDRRE